MRKKTTVGQVSKYNLKLLLKLANKGLQLKNIHAIKPQPSIVPFAPQHRRPPPALHRPPPALSSLPPQPSLPPLPLSILSSATL
jgi:hypothetical protein